MVMDYGSNAISISRHSRGRRFPWKRVLLWAAIVVIVLILGLFLFLQAKTYSPLEEALTALESDGSVQVSELKHGYRFEPAASEALLLPNIIFYPGGLVKPESYAPLARRLAEAGHRVYVASMPFNLALTAQDRADEYIAEHPEESYVIGGHSLGGAFAARYAAEHPNKLAGIFFMGAYADDGADLSGSKLAVLQITGSLDAVLNKETWEQSKQNLPAELTEYVSIEGGNHGGFGTYGKQSGDNDATISAAEQADKVAAAIDAWLSKLQK